MESCRCKTHILQIDSCHKGLAFVSEEFPVPKFESLQIENCDRVAFFLKICHALPIST